MNINISEDNGVSVVGLIGNLDANTSTAVNVELSKFPKGGIQKMLIDLTETNYLSSAGSRVFLSMAKKMSANGGQVKLSNPNMVVRKIRDIYSFSTSFDVKGSKSVGFRAINQ